jgi:CubicO group peptidase (beta-lactamase class C family)
MWMIRYARHRPTPLRESCWPAPLEASPLFVLPITRAHRHHLASKGLFIRTLSPVESPLPMTRNSISGSWSDSINYKAALRIAEPIIKQACVDSGTPGLAIGVFDQHGKAVDKYIGFRDIKTAKPPDEKTVFNIGSMCKGFTSLAVACLVADGKIKWDDPIGNHLPELSSEANGRFSIRDLLSHRTGLCRSDGLFIGSNNELLISKAQGSIIFAALDAPLPIRQDFLYNNLGYHAIGCVIERVSYGEFLRRRIFKPLGMDRTYTTTPPASDGNIARAYLPYQNLRLRQVPSPSIADDTVAFAAGSIRSCMHDLLFFYGALLRRTTSLLPKSVFHELEVASKEMRTMFEACMPLPLSSSLREQSYGLGWARTQLPNTLSEISGNSGLLNNFPIVGTDTKAPLVLHHGGNNIGCSSSVYVMPELGSGIVVLGNALGHCDATDWAAQVLLDTILRGQAQTSFLHHISAAAQRARTAMERVQETLDKEKPPCHPPTDLQMYTGTFWHLTKQFCIVVKVVGKDRSRVLQMMFQGREAEKYTLKHYSKDVFVFNESFDRLVDRGQWCRPYWFYKIEFRSSGKSIDAIRWRIDEIQEEGQIFTKEM